METIEKTQPTQRPKAVSLDELPEGNYVLPLSRYRTGIPGHPGYAWGLPKYEPSTYDFDLPSGSTVYIATTLEVGTHFPRITVFFESPLFADGSSSGSISETAPSEEGDYRYLVVLGPDTSILDTFPADFSSLLELWKDTFSDTAQGAPLPPRIRVRRPDFEKNFLARLLAPFKRVFARIKNFFRRLFG